MNLITPTAEHIKTLMTWFKSEQELKNWSGPNFRYPYTQQSFTEDLRTNELQPYVLLSLEDELLAFGQFYLRLGKCHLGRLVVNPNHRGQGIAGLLISSLCELGNRELDTSESSLFVLSHNESAVKAYEKMGFIEQAYPEPIPLENCLYMVKTN